MRKIDTSRIRPATRTTQRAINRTILLNLIRELQPISRADLARRMQIGRSMVTALVDDLLAEGVVWEGASITTPRGRRPVMLHIRDHDRYAVAVDIRLNETTVTLGDFACRQYAQQSFKTLFEPRELAQAIGAAIARVMEAGGAQHCEGVAVIVPGMVDSKTGRVLNSPQLRWRDVPLRELIQRETGLRVVVENAPIACALGHAWMMPDTADDFAYVAVSDGVGVGMVMNGEVVRGYASTAGEFGHLTLEVKGPRCLCGLRGCWEAYVSTGATLARYFGTDLATHHEEERQRKGSFGIPNLRRLAQSGDLAAETALLETGWYLGAGIANIITAFNPAKILVGGEITAAWDVIGETVESVARERVLTDAAARTVILPVSGADQARFRGAIAMISVKQFALPKIA